KRVATQAQPRPAPTTVFAGRFGLQPIEQAEAQLARTFVVERGFVGRHFVEVAKPIVVLGPIDQAHVAEARGRLEVGGTKNAAIGPKSPFVTGGAFGVEAMGTWLERDGVGVFPRELAPRPRWIENRHVVAPRVVLARFVDGVVFTGAMFHGEA